MVAIGLPALRVRGLTLAVTTLGLAVIAPDWLYQQGWLGGSTPFNAPVQVTTVLPGLGQIGSQLYLYYVVWSCSLLVVAAAATLRRSAIGRIDHRGAGQRAAIAAFGIKPATVKLRVLALSGFVAASGGVFFAARLAERVAHAISPQTYRSRSSPSRSSAVSGRWAVPSQLRCCSTWAPFLSGRTSAACWAPSGRTLASSCSSVVVQRDRLA